MFKLSSSEKLFEKIVIFYKSAAAAAAATPQNQKLQKIGVAYVVRSLCFNFEQNRTISTMSTSNPAKITH